MPSPVEHKPGTFYTYNSLGTYMLSAIVTESGRAEKVVDYLYPVLFRPLGIVNARWQESPQGINTGGWGVVPQNGRPCQDGTTVPAEKETGTDSRFCPKNG